jgi:hypothetical protein
VVKIGGMVGSHVKGPVIGQIIRMSGAPTSERVEVSTKGRFLGSRLCQK